MINKIHGVKLIPIAVYVAHSGGAAPTRFPVPVLKLSSENQAPTYFGYRAVADVKYRYWEVPGTAHPAHAQVYGDHERYVQKFAAATRAAEASGFILASDARNLITEAAQSNVAK